MAKCDFCGKGVTFGIKVSHSHRRSNRAWKPLRGTLQQLHVTITSLCDQSAVVASGLSAVASGQPTLVASGQPTLVASDQSTLATSNQPTPTTSNQPPPTLNLCVDSAPSSSPVTISHLSRDLLEVEMTLESLQSALSDTLWSCVPLDEHFSHLQDTLATLRSQSTSLTQSMQVVVMVRSHLARHPDSHSASPARLVCQS